MPFVAAVLFLAAVVVTGPRSGRTLFAPLATVLPGAALSVAYLLHTDSGDGATWTNPVGRALGLISLHTTITTYSRWEDMVAVGIAAVLAALALLARRAVPASGARGASAAAGLATVAAAVAVLVVPTNFGIDFGLIDERLAVFPVLFGLLWLAARPPEPHVAIAAATALVVATGALAVVRVPDLQDYEDLAAEYLSAGRYIDEGSVLVALRFANLGPDAGRNSAWDPTRHLSSELAAERHSIDVGHYEAVLDYFPARFREPDARRTMDPDLGGLGAIPPEVDLGGLARALRTGAPSSADVRSGPEPGSLSSPLARVFSSYVLLVGARRCNRRGGARSGGDSTLFGPRLSEGRRHGPPWARRGLAAARVISLGCSSCCRPRRARPKRGGESRSTSRRCASPTNSPRPAGP